MKKKLVQTLTLFVVLVMFLAACTPAAIPVPPTAAQRPSDTPLPSTANPTPVGVSFVENGQQLDPLVGMGVAVADFNGDGNLDAFIVNSDIQNNQDYRVYFGDGQGQFADSSQRLSSSAGGIGNPAVGDINEDGGLEVIVGWTVWLNDGQGHFKVRPELIGSSETSEYVTVALADLNGDHHLDAFTLIWNLGSRTGKYRVYLNDGEGHFHDTGQQLGQEVMSSVAFGDVNNDGFVDAVTAGWKEVGTYSPNRVWLNDGKGNFHDSGQILYDGAEHVHGLALGDLNGDGHPDLVLGMNSASRAGQIYLNDGQGRFTARQNLGGTWAQGVALGDFNGDGSLDVFLACGMTPERPPSQVWLNNGKGIFLDSGVRLVNNAISESVALGDFNGDGKLDAFVTNADFVPDGSGSYEARAYPPQVWLNTTP